MSAGNKQRENTPPRSPGRPKGSQNKLTKTVKEAIEAAFEQVGGAEYLAKMAKEQPTAFLALLGKVLPMQVELAGKDGGPIQTEQVTADANAFRSRLLSSASTGAAASGTEPTQH